MFLGLFEVRLRLLHAEQLVLVQRLRYTLADAAPV